MRKVTYLIVVLILILSACSSKTTDEEVKTEDVIVSQASSDLDTLKTSLDNKEPFTYYESSLANGEAAQLYVDFDEDKYNIEINYDQDNYYTYYTQGSEIRDIDLSNLDKNKTKEQIVREAPSKEDIDTIINNNISLCNEILESEDFKDYKITNKNNTYIIKDTREYRGAPTCTISPTSLTVKFGNIQTTEFTLK